MSNFDTAILTVLKHEGRFVNDPSDPGGATNYGVSLRFLKKTGELEWDFDKDGAIDADDIKAMSQEDAISIYRKHWWDEYQYERIINQGVATKLLDLSINMGAFSSHRCLQRAVRSASGSEIILIEDGILGAKSIAAINSASHAELLSSFRSEAAGYYRSLNKPKYIHGWLNRAYEL